MTQSASSGTHPSAALHGSSLSHIPSHARFWIAAAIVLTLDLWSKHWVFSNLQAGETRSFISGFMDLRRSLNDGAVFGSFTGQVRLFMVASVFALGFVFYLFSQSPRSFRGLHIALGFILAGAIGNLYDRSQMIADVLVSSSPGGERVFIGRVVEENDEIVRVVAWPDGKRVQTFQRSAVTVRKQGVVRDLLKFSVHFPAWVPKLGGREVWPWVFNVADAALVCGVGALVCTSWLRRHPQLKP